MKKGRVIYLNGASSSGKTTIAKNFLMHADKPFLYLGLDTFIDMIPEGYFGFDDRAISFMHQKRFEVDGHSLVSIEYGPDGMNLIKTMYKTVANLAEYGMDIIFDDVYWDLNLPAEILKNVEVFLISIYAPLDILEQREISRGNRPAGTARWQYPKIYESDLLYDLQIDTSKLSIDDSYNVLKKALEDLTPTAFDMLRS